jgi:hypothetical protein
LRALIVPVDRLIVWNARTCNKVPGHVIIPVFNNRIIGGIHVREPCNHTDVAAIKSRAVIRRRIGVKGRRVADDARCVSGYLLIVVVSGTRSDDIGPVAYDDLVRQIKDMAALIRKIGLIIDVRLPENTLLIIKFFYFRKLVGEVSVVGGGGVGVRGELALAQLIGLCNCTDPGRVIITLLPGCRIWIWLPLGSVS